MRNKILFIFILVTFLGCKSQSISIRENSFKPDAEIVQGRLDNGLSYFIKENKKPENRIELRLVVNAGSVQEDDDQKGLAHFVEHMAFNGTKNFEKDKLVKYLESLGMGFGPEINAYTSFDETVYMLSLPADDPEALKNGLQILEDWAHNVTFDDEEIEKERGVIVEEWRGGRGVSGRYLDRLIPTLLKDSKYADRLPIGDMDIIQNSDPQRLRDYYKKWYRPESMAVIVVGDINPEDIENKIVDQFSFQIPGEAALIDSYVVPVHDRIDVEIIPDKEMTSSKIQVFIKRPVLIINTEENYRKYIKEFLNTIMFNGRMEEIYTKSDSPFLSAGASYGTFFRNSGLSSFSAQVEEGMSLTGFKALIVEIEKVKQNGYTQAELDRAISQIDMLMTNAFNERDNKVSSEVVREIVDYYLRGDIPLNIEDEKVILDGFLGELTLDEVNSSSRKSFSGNDITVTVHVPLNGSELPEGDNFKDVFKTASSQKYAQRSEEIINRPLFNKDLAEGEILESSMDSETGITTVKLGNGAVVVLKPTDFKADEVLFSAVSFGGLSLTEDEEFRSGSISANLASSSGLNGFDSIELDRLLTGKNVSVSPWIGNYSEGMSGSSSLDDFEVMLQMINLYFTNPEFSKDTYEVILNNLENSIINRDNSPNTIFNDRITEILAQGHLRAMPFTMKSFEDVDFNEVTSIYKERFSDPGDFYYIFTGSFKVEEALPLISKYVGTIPSKGIKENSKDLGIYFPKGVIEEEVVKGIEKKSIVEILFNGEYKGSKEDDFGLGMLANYLEEELRVEIRENMGGTYGVSVFNSIRHFPVKKYLLGVYFGCEPGRDEELSDAVFTEISKLKNGEVNKEGLQAVINNFKRSMELNLKDNNYWHNSIENSLLLNRDFIDIIDVDTSNITEDYLIYLANRYIDMNRYVKVVLSPEGEE